MWIDINCAHNGLWRWIHLPPLAPICEEFIRLSPTKSTDFCAAELAAAEWLYCIDGVFLLTKNWSNSCTNDRLYHSSRLLWEGYCMPRAYLFTEEIPNLDTLLPILDHEGHFLFTNTCNTWGNYSNCWCLMQLVNWKKQETDSCNQPGNLCGEGKVEDERCVQPCTAPEADINKLGWIKRKLERQYTAAM